MGKNGLFTAEELASRFSLSAATIHEYASLGLLHPIDEDHQLFTAGAFTRVEVIEKGKRLGFTLGEIKLLMDGVRKPSYDPPSGSA